MKTIGKGNGIPIVGGVRNANAAGQCGVVKIPIRSDDEPMRDMKQKSKNK